MQMVRHYPKCVKNPNYADQSGSRVINRQNKNTRNKQKQNMLLEYHVTELVKKPNKKGKVGNKQRAFTD